MTNPGVDIHLHPGQHSATSSDMLAAWTAHISSSPSSTSSSTRSSHLSVLTSSSSVSSTPSPLPSPTSNKTYAFFASPFAEDATTPSPPPRLKRSTSIKSSASHSSEASADDTPRIVNKVPRSLNADFFGPSLLPTPPPSIRSYSRQHSRSPSRSRETSPSPLSGKAALPPLSRFFPSRARYGTEPTEAPATNVHRDFMELNGPAVSPRPNPISLGPLYAHETSTSPVEISFPPSEDVTPTPATRQHTSYVTAAPRPPTPISDAKPEPDPVYEDPTPGLVISSTSLSLELVRPLGTGSFSSVWLAKDVRGQLRQLEVVRKSSLIRSRSQRRGRTRKLEGTRPKGYSGDNLDAPSGGDGAPRIVLSATDKGDVQANSAASTDETRLVAVKMTARAMCDKNARSRVSFVREVEVLRHISHPSIVSYCHSFSTASHHCLVLEHIGGGELFDLIDKPESHAQIDEPLLRRMFGELCKAVGWMHSVGLVHRDIKLENILLTQSPFARPLPQGSLVKLTDFGLSRFIDPAQPLLTTLCGSESYAAPELVTGRPYDGRETDAWACGVVLYALATRRLPFDPPRSDHIQHEQLAEYESQRQKRSDRKALLMRIAKGEYGWPADDTLLSEAGDLRGEALAHSEGVRKIVGRLLVRDPKKRAKMADLWAEEWMQGDGAPLLPPAPEPCADPPPIPVPVAATELDNADIDADEEGVLVDGHETGPGSVVRQEH